MGVRVRSTAARSVGSAMSRKLVTVCPGAVACPDLGPALLGAQALAAGARDGVAVPRGVAGRARFVFEAIEPLDATQLSFHGRGRVMDHQTRDGIAVAASREELPFVDRAESDPKR